ncbi:hypothetical protein IDM40_03750 [Nocardiopsis sp. HNM0947]|uniref:DUF4232 domain-containing protein n=1 Tax=Nocardiopsis coralli TaxID=2772213 RepID=A0ABR9P1W8_9ACTN|nr:hypothetical protein [Nocardiopsis coralli]MBE2997827.1 hypothetical protein [Nocardiopsis coralli]
MLAAFLVVVAIVAYACSPSAGEEGQQNQAGAGGDDTEASPSVPPEEPEEDGNGEEDDAEPTEEPSPSEDPSEGGDDEGAEGGDDEGSDGDEGSDDEAEIAAPERAEDPCRPQDVVITFDFEDKKGEEQQYPSGVDPSFIVEVVNTGEQTCTVDVGPEELEMVVTSGDDSVYSTAHCREGDTSDERQLDQGRTHRYTIDWDRERSFSDCRDETSAAGSGWYHAELRGTYSEGADDLRFRVG